jgi:hypothetical protein
MRGNCLRALLRKIYHSISPNLIFPNTNCPKWMASNSPNQIKSSLKKNSIPPPGTSFRTLPVESSTLNPLKKNSTLFPTILHKNTSIDLQQVSNSTPLTMSRKRKQVNSILTILQTSIRILSLTTRIKLSQRAIFSNLFQKRRKNNSFWPNSPPQDKWVEVPEKFTLTKWPNLI